MDRAELGPREFSRATGGKGLAATARVRAASPVLADGVERFIFADVFSRSGLGAREREMITCAVLATIGGADNQLGVHVPAALECGADPDELIQLCEQIAPYCGFPRALNALRAVRAVLEERGLPLPSPVREVTLPDGAGTLVTDAGEGDEGYVFVHSPMLDRQVWRDVIRLMPDGARCVAPDLRGAGAAAGAPPARDGAQLIDDLVAVMDAVGLRRARLVTVGNHGCGFASLAKPAGGASPRWGGAPVTFRILDEYDGKVPAATDVLTVWFTPEQLAEGGWAVRYARDRVARVDVAGCEALAAAMGSVDFDLDADFFAQSHPHPLADPAECVAQILDAGTERDPGA